MSSETAGAEFHEIYRTHRRWLMKRALSKVREAADAEDIVQDAFAKTFEQLHTGSIREVRAYLTRAVDNGAVAWHRKAARREMAIADVPETLAGDEDHLTGLEDSAMLTDALTSLRPRQQRAIQMFAEGVPVHAIAGALGLSSHNASALLNRAKANLRRSLLRRGWVPMFADLLDLRSWRTRSYAWRKKGIGLSLDWRLGEMLLATTLVVAAAVALGSNVGQDGQPGSKKPGSGQVSATRQVATGSEPSVGADHIGRSRGEMSAEIQRTSTFLAELPGSRTIDVYEEEKSGSEPSYLEQIVAYLEDPYIPVECQLEVNCPQL